MENIPAVGLVVTGENDEKEHYHSTQDQRWCFSTDPRALARRVHTFLLVAVGLACFK